MKTPLETTVEPEIGQIYEVERSNTHYQILYADEQVVLLRSDESGRNGNSVHRIERRVEFDKQVESGWFKYRPDSNLDMMSFTEIDWSEVDYIGEKTADNLHDEGYDNNLDIQQADDDELLDVDGVGNKGLANLKRFAR